MKRSLHSALTGFLIFLSTESIAQVDQGLDPLWFTDFNGAMTTHAYPVAGNSVVVSGSSVYVGGGFSNFAGKGYRGIARWDGSKWNDVGGGLNGTVRAMLIAPNGDLYVGGDFTIADPDGDPVAVNRVAKWDGFEWSDFDNGLGFNVHALALDDDGNLYAGGGIPSGANYLFMWDGDNWTDIGPVNSLVVSLIHDGSTLYAAGYFTNIDGVSSKNIAAWDGTNWTSLAGSVTAGDRVLGMTLLNSDLYVVGNFTSIGGVSAKNIAKWNGTTWSPLGNGLLQIEFVVGTTPDGKIWARSPDTPFQSSTIGTWDGTSWTQLGINISSVNGVAFDGNATYIVGDFGILGSGFGNESYFLSGIIKTVGSTAYPLTENLSNPVDAIATSGSDVYVAGQFTRMDAQDAPFNSIAKWNGFEWSRVGTGVTVPGGSAGVIRAIAIEGSTIYVTGYVPGGVQLWNGTQWTTPGLGPGYTLQSSGTHPGALAVRNGNIYVGGALSSIYSQDGITIVNSIAMYDGVKWKPLGEGLNGKVNAIAIDGDDVYAGGAFTKSGDLDILYLARWDGQAWHAVNNTLDGPVRSIEIRGSDIYVAGEFTHAGGLTVNRIAKWNGTSWIALGSGLNNVVNDIALAGQHVFATGEFTEASGAPALRVARWDGTNWSGIGNGLHGPFPSSHVGTALAVVEGAVYVGGNFMEAGSHANSFLAGVHTDFDKDGIPDVTDKCPNHYDPTQFDVDGDGVGSPCDCDDNNASVSSKTWYLDSDGDGAGRTDEKIISCSPPAGYVLVPADCDDGDAGTKFATSWYADADGDGVGNPNAVIVICFKPLGHVSNSLDCDDTNKNLNPNTIWYQDADGDGYGNISLTQAACLKPAGYVSDKTDCDDTKASVNPGTQWLLDADNDGYAAPGALFTVSCTKPNNYALLTGDCDDANAAIFPGATKTPNGKDNDCDGQIDLFDQVVTFPQIADQAMDEGTVFFTITGSSTAPGASITIETASTHVALSLGGFQLQKLSAGSVTLTLKSPAFLGWRAAEATQTFCIKPNKPTILTTLGASITLTSTLPSGNQWFKDGVAIANATGVSFVPTEAGVYKVQGTVEGCASTFSDNVPLVITGVERRTRVAFYPNPVDDILFIDTGSSESTISVYSLDGREIRRASSPGTTEINMRDVATGIYLLKVSGEDGVYVARFLKR